MAQTEGAARAGSADAELLLTADEEFDRLEGGNVGHPSAASRRTTAVASSQRRRLAACSPRAVPLITVAAVVLAVLAFALPDLRRRAGALIRGRAGAAIERPELIGGGGSFGAAGMGPQQPCVSSMQPPRKWRESKEASALQEVRTWQVVYPGLMNVRSAKLYLSRVIGMKASCLMVQGTKEDNWVRLLGEPGFMMISLNGTKLMEESTITYTLIAEGNCKDIGRHPIADLETCQAATLALGLPETTATAQAAADESPFGGCYMQGTSVFLSNKAGDAAGVADGARQLVCSSHATPEADPCRKMKGGSPQRSHHMRLPTEPEPAEVPQAPAEAPAEPTAAPAPHQALFCFSVVEPRGHGPELMVAQIENRAGVFSCDTSVVYSVGQVLPLTPGWKTTMVPAPEEKLPPHAPERQTLILMEVWDAVLKHDRFKKSDWIVKVAQDTVFFAARLRHKLAGHQAVDAPLKGDSRYILNCKTGRAGEPAMLDSLEVISRRAMEVYGEKGPQCKKGLPWHTWTENTYIQQCLAVLGVTSILDSDMVVDSRCHKPPTRCGDVSKVAFHDYGDASKYLNCWEEATEAEMASDFLKSVGQ